MKILFIGSLSEGQTSLMRMNVLSELGYDVIPLSNQFYWDQARMLTRRIQQSLEYGPIIERINRELLISVKNHKPDMIWAEKQEYLKVSVLQKISQLGIKLVHYTPDPYFSLSWKRTRHLDASLSIYDCLITSKRYEVKEYENVNSNILYMPLGFSTEVHRPIIPKSSNLKRHYTSDVSFVGGWEPRREEYLSFITDKLDCDLKVWGYGWDFLKDGKWTLRRWWGMRRNSGGESFKIRKNFSLSKCVIGNEIYGDHYSWALSGAKINIGFLRNICPDQHTTRTFEIPACQSLLLADRSDEHIELFREGKEADYFSSKEEMVDKIKFYLSNESVRKKVAINGYERCQNAGFSYKDILIEALAELSKRDII